MDNLKLGVQWDVNDQALQNGMNNSKKSIESVAQSVELLEDKVASGFGNIVSQQNLLDKTWEQLKIQADSYARMAATSLDPDVIAKYNRLLSETNVQMAKMKNIGVDINPGTAARSNWNGLQNSINQISRELPAFTYSFQTGVLAMTNNLPIVADEIVRLKQENDALVASGQKGIPIWKQLMSSILSWNTLMSVGIMLASIYGKEIGEFFMALFKGGEAARDAALKVEMMNKALSSGEYGKAIKEVTELRSAINGAKDGVVSKSDAIKLYNSTIGKTTGEIKTWNELESWQVANEKKYLEFMYRKAEAQAMLQVAIDKTIEAQKKSIEGPSFGDYIKAYQLTGAVNLEESAQFQNTLGIAKFQVQAKKGIEMFAKANEDLQRYAKDNGFDLYQFKDSKADQSKIIMAHKSLMDDIKQIDQEYSSQFFTDQQKESLALEQKFAKLKEKIVEFNRDPANVVKIDLNMVDDLQSKLAEQLSYKQDTEGLVKMYESDFESWKEFEELKKRTSEEYARDRYGNLADYYQGLEERIWTSIEELNSKGDLSPKELHRLNAFYKVLDDVSNYRTSLEDAKFAEDLKRYEKMLSDYATYEQKRQKIIKESEEKISLLNQKGEQERAEQARKERDKSLLELAKKEVEGLGGIDGLLEAMEHMSLTAQSQGIKAAKRIFEEWIKQADLTEKEVEQLRRVFSKFFKDAESKNLQALTADLQQAFSVFDNIASDISQVDQQFGKVLKTLTNIIGGVLDLNTQIKKVKTDGTANFGSFMGIYGAMVQVGTNIFNAINAAAEQEWNDKVMLRTKELEAQNDLLEYQIALVDTLNGTDKLDQLKDNLVATKALIEEYRKDLTGATIMTGDSRVDPYLESLNSGKETVDSILKRIENAKWRIQNLSNSGSDAALAAGIKADIANAEKALEFYRSSLKLTGQETLEQLIELSGKVDEETKNKIDKLIEYEHKLAELSKSISENVLGFSAQNMVNEIVSMFSQGKMSAKDFTENFESLMKKAIIKSLETRFLDEQLNDFYKEFQKIVNENDDGDDETAPIDANDMRELKEKYDKIISDGKKQLDAWSQVTGLDFSDTSAGGLGSSGIERISEQTATELLGLYRSQYDITKRQYQDVVQILEFDIKAYDQMLAQVAYLKLIEQHAQNSLSELKKVMIELKSINENTKIGYFGS
ncbi:hypothetical protein [Sphingobacterium hotanense]|uniref:Phage tail tape measure protein n=1 Tax=Sphingobacterium hotanense TaxID=649196 RepID=A0ABT7NLH8_9SPHI|nr:hypothetical protein [Sphingobacterium hotanense]MDM1048063.1 hypothetical protein [Sphingobacterium hotanense]